MLVKNTSGNYVFPSSENDATALTHARIQPDLISDLSGVHSATETNAYPIAGYSYMITPDHGAGQLHHRQGRGAREVHPLQRLRRPAEGRAARLLAADSGAGKGRVRGRAADPRRSGAAAALQVRQPDAARGGTSGGPTGNGGPPPSSGNGGSTSTTTTNQSTGKSGSKTSTGTAKTTSKTSSPKGPATTTTTGLATVSGAQLTNAELATREAQVLTLLASVQPSSSLPLLWIALDILVFALVPWLFWHHRRSRNTLREYDSQDGEEVDPMRATVLAFAPQPPCWH